MCLFLRWKSASLLHKFSQFTLRTMWRLITTNLASHRLSCPWIMSLMIPLLTRFYLVFLVRWEMYETSSISRAPVWVVAIVENGLLLKQTPIATFGFTLVNDHLSVICAPMPLHNELHCSHTLLLSIRTHDPSTLDKLFCASILIFYFENCVTQSSTVYTWTDWKYF